MGEIQARYAVEMALTLCGGRESLRKKPPLSSVICTIAPLGHDPHGLEAALVFAEAGFPVGFMAMNTMMTTGPVTPAGCLVAGNAEIISGVVLLQLAFPGVPTFFSFIPGTMDPRTSLYLDHTPWSNLMIGGGVELAHAQGMSCLALGGNSNAYEPGWQYAKEDSTFVSMLTGAEMILRFGTMEGAAVGYPEAIILDCDKLVDDRVTVSGLDITRESMALDVIRDVGPRGTYLTTDHTIQNMRKIPLSDLIMETRRKERVCANGVIETAREKLKWILENHEPPALDKNMDRELDNIIEAADREINNV
jgi:trimethylamine--corrinoid protein Co-methyltransferase